MSKKLVRIILLSILIVAIGIQFIRPNRQTPETLPGTTLEDLSRPPAEIADLMEMACYDCHSYTTEYPWYANVAPVSWWIADHVEEGREHLNFTTWGAYSYEERIHKVEEAIEEVREGHMPLESYTWMHQEARLTQEQRDQLLTYFVTLKSELQNFPAMPPSVRQQLMGE